MTGAQKRFKISILFSGNFKLIKLVGLTKRVARFLVYIDDIVIHAKTLEEHEKLFDEVMNRLRKASWKLELKKCELLKYEVTYLGHIISAKGLNSDPKKVGAVREFPKLKSLQKLR